MEYVNLIFSLISLTILIVFLIRIHSINKITASQRKEIHELRKQLEFHSRESTEHSKLMLEQSLRTNESLVRQVTMLGDSLREDQRLRQDTSQEILKGIETEMKALRQDNSESLDRLRRTSQESLDRINETVNDKLQKTLDDRISKSFETVNKRLAEVYEGLGEMKSVASGVTDLKKVLSNVKTRGIMGEIQLGAILGEILPPEQYGEQVQLAPGKSERVDFAVKLPGQGDGEIVYLPIDSKFPGDTYSNLLAAYEIGTQDELRAKRSALDAEIKRCARSIHDKYIIPPHTTDFAVMFLPFEGLYAEVVNMGLVEVLQRDYRVNIAGPSTMAAMLNSLQMGFRTLAIQQKSGEVWTILEAAKKEFGTFEAVLTSTRQRLRQADEELDKLIGTRTRAINRKLSTVSKLEPGADTGKILELD